MTNILELLKNEKVEWKKLGEVCEFINGFAFKSSLFSQSGEAVIRITNINSGKVTFDDLKYIKLDDYPELDRYKVEKNNILVAMSGATTGKIGYQYEDRIGYLNQRVGKFIPDESKVKRRFLFHFLYNIESELFSLATGSGAQPNLSSEAIKKIDIPIPSLEIQERIVKILDKFTNYVTELQSELQSRTKQYTHYRDKLLSEEYLTKVTKEMEEDRRLNIVTLGEIGEFTRGNGLQKKDFLDEGNPVIHYGQIYTKYGFVAEEVLSYVSDEIFSKLRKAQKNDILIATTSENVEDVGKSVVWVGEDEIGFSGDMYSYRTKQNSKYIAYYFQTNAFQKQKERKATGTKMIRIHGDDMEKFEIPLPPLSLQNKIVKVLDKFQILLSDTKGLLPEEIEQRQKQYEYYREKLLTFDVECSRTNERTFIISNIYYDILQEAAIIVEVDIEDRVEWEKVSSFCKRQKGINITAKEMKELAIEDGTVKVFAGGNTIAYLDVEVVGKDNIIGKPSIIVKSRGNIDFEYYDGMFSHKNEMWSYSINSENNIKYLYYYLKNNIEYFRSRAISGKLPQIATGITDNYKIPIPPLHVQQHVVSILDKFDTLVNDIKEGLPKEIEQRQKQYEYWRDCLLNFPR